MKKRMTQKQKVYRSALVQAVHLSKKYREYFKDNREEYEEALFKAFGVRSSKELSISDLEVFTDWLNYRIDALPEFVPEKITDNQLKMLRKLWSEYANDKTDEALLKFVHRITKQLYLKLDLVKKGEATKCITALKHTLGGK